MPAVVDDFVVGAGAAVAGVIQAGAATAPFSSLPPAGNFANQTAQQSCVLPTDQELMDGSYSDPGECSCYEDDYSPDYGESGSSQEVETAPQPVSGDKPSHSPQPAAAKPAKPARDSADNVVAPADDEQDAPPPPEPPETPIDEFNRHVTAANEANAASFVGLFFPPMLELALDITLIGQEDTEYGRTVRELAEKAIDEVRTFGEAGQKVAADKSENAAYAGSITGGLLPEIVSPSSKAKAGVQSLQAAKMLVNGARAGLLERLIQKLLKGGSKNKERLKKAMADLAQLAEKSEAYRVLTTERKVLKTVPRKKSTGEWFEKYTSFKDHQFEGKLKKSLNGTGRVQIDDLLVAEKNGKLVLVETKAMMVDDMSKSAHLVFAEDKVDTLLRYIQFAKENPDAVSHVKIMGNNPEVVEIYKAILESKLIDRGASIGITKADIDAIVEYGLFWK